MTNILLTPYDGAILGPIAKLLGVIMDAIYMFMYNVFGVENVGLSIILFTIVIYTLMLPLTYQQQKFSKLNQAMQPELKAIQDKYKGKKDEASQMAMNSETQMIYDKYGVNPMGSCGQMLIQMPILFALYRVFYNVPAYISAVRDKFIVIADEIMTYDGFAEIMKHGLIKDASFYEWLITNMYEICERELDVVEEMIMQSCTIKKLVVEKDPFEEGDRKLLNFGHTIGHAIEKAKGFELLHGECVALGCIAAAHISYQRQLITLDEYLEVRDMFVPFYLPITIEDINPEEVLEFTKSDKKMQAGKMSFVLLKRIGKSMVDTTVKEEEVKAAIREIHFSEEDMKE